MLVAWALTVFFQPLPTFEILKRRRGQALNAWAPFARTSGLALRFRTVVRMNFRNEPTPDLSQEGNCVRTRAGLLPSFEGLGVGLRLGIIRKFILTISPSLFVLLWALPAATSRADSVVVFNEIMYHPSA